MSYQTHRTKLNSSPKRMNRLNLGEKHDKGAKIVQVKLEVERREEVIHERSLQIFEKQAM